MNKNARKKKKNASRAGGNGSNVVCLCTLTFASLINNSRLNREFWLLGGSIGSHRCNRHFLVCLWAKRSCRVWLCPYRAIFRHSASHCHRLRWAGRVFSIGAPMVNWNMHHKFSYLCSDSNNRSNFWKCGQKHSKIQAIQCPSYRWW